MNKSYNFTQKIECIYKNIAKLNLSALVELFENGTSKKHRTIHIQNKWLRKSNKDYKPRAFKKEYFSYPFYKTIAIDGKPLFKSGEEFLEISLEEFCQRVNSYINIIDNPYNEFRFEYFLYYSQESQNKFNIKQLQIVYSSSKPSATRQEIKLYNIESPNKSYYSGQIYTKEQKLILEFSNDSDQIMAIFNLEMLNSKSKELVGVAIGISDINQKIPVAKKVTLYQQKPNESDLNSLYLTLNQSEIIFANENIFNFEIEQSNILNRHFAKYYDKIFKIDSFFNILVQNDFNYIKYRLAKEQFHSVTKIFEKVKNNQEFYISSFYQGLKSILLSFRNERYIKLYMLMPIYNKDFIFNYISKDANNILALLKNINEKSIEIEIIFITNSCAKNFNEPFKKNLSILEKVATIYFIHKDKIDKNYTTNEFIYNNKRDFILYKPNRSYKNIYKYSTDKEFVEYIDSFFAELRYLATKLQDLQSKICAKKENIYNTWYLYTQGTQQLWELLLIIFEDNSVTISYKNNIIEKGILIKNKEQSIIVAEDTKSNKSQVFYFDNNSVNQDIFLLYTTAKAYMQSETIFSISIASKEKLDINEVKNLLQDETLYCNCSGIKERLSNFVFEKYGK